MLMVDAWLHERAPAADVADLLGTGARDTLLYHDEYDDKP
jgi:hypothetical protein